MAQREEGTLALPGGERLAWRRLPAAAQRPTLLWLPGLKSDMSGIKACAMERFAAARGLGYLALDYRGHGLSDGSFEDCVLSDWRADVLSAVDRLTGGPLLLVGSSMGAWLALLCALARPCRAAALVLVAPAPDFTERLLLPSLGEEQHSALRRRGRVALPSAYGEPLVISRALLEDARRWLLLDGAIAYAGPVRLLHGMADPDIPWRHALQLLDALESRDVTLTLVRDGDHRLSREADIDRLRALCEDALRALESG